MRAAYLALLRSVTVLGCVDNLGCRLNGECVPNPDPNPTWSIAKNENVGPLPLSSFRIFVAMCLIRFLLVPFT